LLHEYVTGGGLAGQELPASLAAEGRAMRRALATDFAAAGRRVIMTLDPRLPDEPGPWTVARLDLSRGNGPLADLAAGAGLALVVAPETERALDLAVEAVLGAGCPSIGCEPAAIAQAGDKLWAIETLQEAGLPVPPTLPVLRALPPPGEEYFPGVLKPQDGAGSLHTVLVPGPAAWRQSFGPLRAAVLQPYVPGPSCSASFLVDGRGEPHPVGIGRQRIALDGLRFAYRGGSVPDPEATPEMARVCAAAMRVIPGLRGWVGVDFLVDAEGAVRLLEINPRVTTSYVGWRALLPAGALARAWLDLLERPDDPRAAAPLDGLDGRDPVAFLPDGSLARPAVSDVS
jgi:predicted ATP-grasp superfamily ATP-dependent carboligase